MMKELNSVPTQTNEQTNKQTLTSTTTKTTVNWANKMARGEQNVDSNSSIIKSDLNYKDRLIACVYLSRHVEFRFHVPVLTLTCRVILSEILKVLGTVHAQSIIKMTSHICSRQLLEIQIRRFADYAHVLRSRVRGWGKENLMASANQAPPPHPKSWLWDLVTETERTHKQHQCNLCRPPAKNRFR